MYYRSRNRLSPIAVDQQLNEDNHLSTTVMPLHTNQSLSTIGFELLPNCISQPATSSDDRRSYTSANSVQLLDIDDRVRLNVGGIRYETYRYVLKKIPATRLSRLTTNVSNYNSNTEEYVFDRSAEAFELILNYYRTGKLHYPKDLCAPMFEDELIYWGIEKNQVQPCCWITYTAHLGIQHTLAVMDSFNLDRKPTTDLDVAKKFGWEDEYYNTSGARPSHWHAIKPIVWLFLDDPWSSTSAMLLNIISLSFVVISLLSMVSRTFTMFQIVTLSVIVDQNLNMSSTNNYAVYKDRTTPDTWFFYVDIGCNIWFIVELCFRLVFCPSRLQLLQNWITLGSITAICTFLLTSTLQLLPPALIGSNFDFLQFLLLARLFSVFKVVRRYTPFKILANTLLGSARPLFLIGLLLVIVSLVIASILYAIETLFVVDTPINSVLIGAYWSMQTVTAVGCNFVPKSVPGKFVGATLAIIGVMVKRLPIPIITENFAQLYRFVQTKRLMPKREQNRLLLIVQPKQQLFRRQLHRVNDSGSRDGAKIRQFTAKVHHKDQ